MLHSSGYGLAAFRVAGALGHSFRFQQRDVASRAGQGARPTWVSCCLSNYLSQAHTQVVRFRVKSALISVDRALIFGGALVMADDERRFSE